MHWSADLVVVTALALGSPYTDMRPDVASYESTHGCSMSAVSITVSAVGCRSVQRRHQQLLVQLKVSVLNAEPLKADYWTVKRGHPFTVASTYHILLHVQYINPHQRSWLYNYTDNCYVLCAGAIALRGLIW